MVAVMKGQEMIEVGSGMVVAVGTVGTAVAVPEVVAHGLEVQAQGVVTVYQSARSVG